MDDNLHKDQLEEFFRNAIEDYTEEPPDDWWEELEAKIPPKPILVKRLWQQYNWAVAAILLVALGGALLFWNSQQQQKLTAQLDEQQEVIEGLTQQIDHLSDKITDQNNTHSTSASNLTTTAPRPELVAEKTDKDKDKNNHQNQIKSTKTINQVQTTEDKQQKNQSTTQLAVGKLKAQTKEFEEKAISSALAVNAIQRDNQPASSTKANFTKEKENPTPIVSTIASLKEKRSTPSIVASNTPTPNVTKTQSLAPTSTTTSNTNNKNSNTTTPINESIVVAKTNPTTTPSLPVPNPIKSTTTATPPSYTAQMNSFAPNATTNELQDQNWQTTNANQEAIRAMQAIAKAAGRIQIPNNEAVMEDAVPMIPPTVNWMDRVLDQQDAPSGQLVGTNVFRQQTTGASKPLVAVSSITDLEKIPSTFIEDQIAGATAQPPQQLLTTLDQSSNSVLALDSKNKEVKERSKWFKTGKKQGGKGQLAALKRIKPAQSNWYLMALAGPQYAFRYTNNSVNGSIRGLEKDAKVESIKEKGGLSYDAGLRLGWRANKKWGIETGLEYQNKSFIVTQAFKAKAFKNNRGEYNRNDERFSSYIYLGYDSSYGTLDYDMEVNGDNKIVEDLSRPDDFEIASSIVSNFRFSSLQLPIKGIYRLASISDQSRWTVVFKGGLVGEFLLGYQNNSPNIDISNQEKSSAIIYYGITQSFEPIRSITINVELATALGYQLTPKTALVVEPFYSHGLNSFEYKKNRTTGLTTRSYQTRNFALGANVGMRVAL